jgi:hypothetical protein
MILSPIQVLTYETPVFEECFLIGVTTLTG